MWVAEVDGDAGVLGDPGVLCHLTPLVIRHTLPCGQWHSIQRRAEACYRGGSGGIVHLRQNQVTTFEFDEGTDGRCIALALDEVAFPMPWEFAFFHPRRAQVNADHVRNLVASINLPATGLSSGFPLPQAVDQLLPNLIDRQGVDGAVDGFTADVGVSKVRDIHMLELAADLFGRQAMTQHVLNQGEPKAAWKQFAPWPTIASTVMTALLSVWCAIPAIRRPIAPYLSTDRRRGPFEQSRYLPDAQALREADLDRGTFFGAEFRI